MADSGRFDLNAELLNVLLQKISEDRYPSTTMLNMCEQLLSGSRDERRYAQILLERIADDTFPSIPMIQRLQQLGG